MAIWLADDIKLLEIRLPLSIEVEEALMHQLCTVSPSQRANALSRLVGNCLLAISAAADGIVLGEHIGRKFAIHVDALGNVMLLIEGGGAEALGSIEMRAPSNILHSANQLSQRTYACICS